MKKLFIALLFAGCALVLTHAQSNANREAVKQAVLDYVEGLYQADPARIERSVHPELVKRGFELPKGQTVYRPDTMTFKQLLDLAARWNKAGRLPKDAPKGIVIYDVTDQTATAKLTAIWGIDYLHLAKYDGQWKIINVLWQTPPRPTQ